jgi:hypothetical protein
MGFLNNLFQSKPDYPAISPDNPLAEQLRDVETPLQSLMSKVDDRLEIVPLKKRSIIFIGKPPKGRFGVAWIEDGKIQNFQSLAKEKGIAPAELHKFGEKFRAAYEHSMNTQRFTANVAGRDVVVTPDQALGEQIEEVIHTALQ